MIKFGKLETERAALLEGCFQEVLGVFAERYPESSPSVAIVALIDAAAFVMAKAMKPDTFVSVGERTGRYLSKKALMKMEGNGAIN